MAQMSLRASPGMEKWKVMSGFASGQMVLALTELVTAAMKTYGGDEEAGGRESVEVRGSPLLQEVIDLGPCRADQ